MNVTAPGLVAPRLVVCGLMAPRLVVRGLQCSEWLAHGGGPTVVACGWWPLHTTLPNE